MTHKKCSKVSVIHALDGSIASFFIANKLDLTAKSSVTNTVGITRAHCTFFSKSAFFISAAMY